MRALYLCDDCSFESTARLCATNGLGIEVQSFYDPSFLPANPNSVALHQKLLAPLAARSMHGPFGDLCAGSFDPMIREVTRTRYEEAVRVAKALGINQIVLHHGYVPSTSQHPQWIKRFTKFWHDFLADKPSNLQFYLENHLDQSPQLLSEVVLAIDDLRVRVCLDIGHAHLFSTAGPLAWTTVLKDQIAYVHLHDNHGLTDEHLGLGDGNAPLEVTLRSLNENAPEAIWALEAKPDRFLSSLDWLAEHRFV